MSLGKTETEPSLTNASARRNGRWSGYLQLLLVRLIELRREPEVVFWVFVFPILLAGGLGLAFRDKPAGITWVALIDGTGAQKTLAMLQNSSNRHPTDQDTPIRATDPPYHFSESLGRSCCGRSTNVTLPLSS